MSVLRFQICQMKLIKFRIVSPPQLILVLEISSTYNSLILEIFPSPESKIEEACSDQYDSEYTPKVQSGYEYKEAFADIKLNGKETQRHVTEKEEHN